MRFISISIFALGSLLVFQLWSRSQARVPDLPEPEIGGQIPDVPLIATAGSTNAAGLAEVLEQTPGCDIVVLASAYCSHCQRYQLTWDQTYRTWADSVGQRIEALWVFREEPEVADAFFGDRVLTNVTPWSLRGHAAESWERLGVFATPMTYLVDASGTIRGGTLGTKLPSAAEAVTACGL